MKQQTVKRFTKWKIKFVNNFAIHSKFHLNNRVYIFRSIYKLLNQTPQTLNHSFSLQREKLVRYIIKYSTTLIHCHLFCTLPALQVSNISIYWLLETTVSELRSLTNEPISQLTNQTICLLITNACPLFYNFTCLSDCLSVSIFKNRSGPNFVCDLKWPQKAMLMLKITKISVQKF